MAQSRGGSPRPHRPSGNAKKARSRPPRTTGATPSSGTRPGPARTGRAPATQPGRALGSRPGRLGVAIVAGGTATGAILTILAGSDPGLLLGLFLVSATIVGTLVVAIRSAYVVIPVPAIAYPVAALLTGYIHDHAVVTSLTGFAVNAVQWIASGFVAMTTATVVAIALAAGRWMFAGQGGRLAYRDLPLRGARRGRYRGPGGPEPAAGDQRKPEAGSMPAESRRTG